MALLQWNFTSKYLYGNTEIKVILPDRPFADDPMAFYASGKKYPVLYLLHGTFGDSSDWLRRSNIELYATEHDVIVVMPSAFNSNYASWPSFGIGCDVFSFLTEELMPMITGWLPVSPLREDTCIAGLSMGGRGTLIYALNHPDVFSKAAVLSSCPIDIDWIQENNPAMYDRFLNEWNTNNGGPDGWRSSQYDTLTLLRKLKDDPMLPELLFASGTDDHLYPAFRHFRSLAEGMHLKADFVEIDGYKHEWRFWDLMIERVIKRFFSNRKEEQA